MFFYSSITKLCLSHLDRNSREISSTEEFLEKNVVEDFRHVMNVQYLQSFLDIGVVIFIVV